MKKIVLTGILATMVALASACGSSDVTTVQDIKGNEIELEALGEDVVASINDDLLAGEFQNISLDTTAQDIESFASENGLVLAQRSEDTSGESDYIIAYDEGVAVFDHAESGICIEVSFGQNGLLTVAEYNNPSTKGPAVLYNYGNYFDLREKEPGNEMSGYYHSELGHLVKCENAKQALGIE